jgi:DNA invertase Pin-like site-specific DNA recombinase
MSEHKQAIVFCRTSTLSSEGMSKQMQACHEYCKQNELSVITTICAVGQSFDDGSISIALKLSLLHEVPVVCYSVDRLSRNLDDLVSIIKDLRSVFFVSQDMEIVGGQVVLLKEPDE